MNKPKFETPDMTQKNIDKITQLFPNCITETKDENGNLKKAVNFELLQQMLSDEIADKDEVYEFTWVGKNAAIVEANKPIRKTLRPCKEESVNWDTTENLYIEGDNLEVLKLLQESYLGKVKMIYIDPPYNTGNDLIYCDDFSITREDFDDEIGTIDENGNRLFRNTDTNGRFHSDWCSMIYSRLLLARNLLSDDGVIFISIDDNEVENMKKICDEIFNNSNFINLVTIKTKIGGVSGSSEGKSLRGATEYLLIYSRNKEKLYLNPVYIKTKLSTKIKNYEESGKSWKYTSVLTKLDGKTLIREDKTKKMKYYGYKVVETKSISAFAKENKMTEEQVYDQYADKIFQTTNAQTSIRQTVLDVTEKEEYEMIGLEYTPIKGKNADSVIEIFYKGEQRRMMMFLSDAVTRIDGEYFYLDKITTLWDDILYNNLAKEGDVDYSNGKKPIFMIQRIIEMVANNDDIILDFFAGSASTAHATIEMSKTKNMNLKFIMVQLPENLDESYRKADANGKKDIKVLIDYLDKIKKPHLLTEIGKQRIRNVGKQIQEENPLTTQDLDIGFRVLKVDDSNMKEVYYSATEYTQNNLDGLESNIKEDRNDLDLLFGCLLDWGLPLSLPYTSETIGKFTVHTYNDDDLVACFNEDVSEEVVKEIARKKPLRAVFRDSSFSNSASKINVFEIFKMISPETSVKVI